MVLVGQLVLQQHDGPPYDGIPTSGRNLIVLGFVVIAISSYFFDARTRGPEWIATLPRSVAFRAIGARAVLFGIGAIAFAFLTLRLLGGSTSGSDLWLWMVALVGFASPFAPSTKRILVGLRAGLRSIKATDVAIVSTLIAIFLAFNLGDLTDWYYVAIGDEYAIWELVKHFADNGISDPFSQIGVYDHHPRLGLALKSAVMRFVGADYFGWKSSSVFIAAMTIPGVYWAGTMLGGRVAGAVAAGMFAFSHYVFALAHAGISPIDSLLPSIVAVALFILGTRSKSGLIIFLAGATAGLCFYFNYSARIIMLILFLLLLFETLPKLEIRRGSHLVLGFLWAVWPLFLVNGPDVITSMLSVAIGGQPEASDGTLIDRLLTNVHLNIYAFNFNERSSHYISGPLLDSISGAVGLMAAAFTVGRLRKPSARLLVLWFIIGFLATGVASPYWHTAITRLYPLLLPISLMTGLFIAKTVWPVEFNLRASSDGRTILNPKFITAALMIGAGLIVLMLNVQRFTSETPEVFHVHPAAVGIGAMQSQHCGHFERKRIAFVSRDEHLIRRILDSFEPGSVQIFPIDEPKVAGTPTFLNPQEAKDQGIPQAGRYGCIIFTHTWETESGEALGNLYAANPIGTVVPFSDPSNKTTINIFRMP